MRVMVWMVTTRTLRKDWRMSPQSQLRRILEREREEREPESGSERHREREQEPTDAILREKGAKYEPNPTFDLNGSS